MADELRALRNIGAGVQEPSEMQRLAARHKLAAEWAPANSRRSFVRPPKTRRSIIGLLLAAVLAGGAVAGASGLLSKDDFDRTSTLTGSELGGALDLPQASWEPGQQKAGQPLRFSSEPGDVAGCGGNAREDTMRVATPSGTVYCIEGIITGDPASMFMARSIAQRLIYDHVPSDLETRVLWIDTQLNVGNPTPEEAQKLNAEMDRLWARATPAELRWLEK